MVFRLGVLAFFWELNRRWFLLKLVASTLPLAILIRDFFAHDTLVGCPYWGYFSRGIKGVHK
jgi:hypothetical protein